MASIRCPNRHDSHQSGHIPVASESYPESTSSCCETASEPLIADQPKFLILTEPPRVLPRMLSSNHSPFLRLPTELRLRIYSLLVLPLRDSELLPSNERAARSMPSSFAQDRAATTIDRHRPSLSIRIIDPKSHSTRCNAGNTVRRSTFSVRSGAFRASTNTTTYHCINVPRIEYNLGILGANRQIHAEAAEMLYSAYTFDFDTHVEAIIPFMRDLTPFARSRIRSLRVVKRGLAYEKEFDRCEWSAAMRYLTAEHTGLSLRRLDLGVVAGRPGPNGWDRIARYSASDFSLLKDIEGMEWMQYLLEFRGLEEVNVSAVVEHCAPASNSMAMAGFVRFSASVETGFREFLTRELLPTNMSTIMAAA